MGRKVAIPWHASFSIAAGVLYYFFVLPRPQELMGETTHALGTTFRIVTGVLLALAALPVVFTLIRTRKPELGTPQLALTIRVWSIVAHVLAGVLIIGTAIAEIWLSLDKAGQYLFGIYGAAAAIAVLGFLAFYLSFVAELPPPPPKPIKAKKPKEPSQRGRRRTKGGDEADEEIDEIEEAEDDEDAEAAVDDETDEAEVPDSVEETVEATALSSEPESVTEEAPATEDAEDDKDDKEPAGGLRNRRPTGKGSHRMRRRRTPGGVALDE